jgi:hypothetical protein
MKQLTHTHRSTILRLTTLALLVCAAMLALSGGVTFAASKDAGSLVTKANYMPSGGEGSDDRKPTPTPSPSATPTPSPTPSPTATPTPDADEQETRVEIDLVGAALNGATPRGEAELRRRADGRREFEVKVQNVNLPAGTHLNVLVDGTKVGEIILSSLMAGEFEVETEHGQTLPPIVNGTTVTVTDPNGATIVAGSFTITLPPPGPTPTPSPTPTPTPQPGADVRLRIPLVGSAINGVIPKGHADFRQRADGRRQLEVEIEDVNLPAGTTFTVLVDNVNVGQIVLGQFFKGELELEAEAGQSVPAVQQGTTVAVVNSTGTTILAGVFGTNSSAPAQVNPLEDVSFFVRQQYIDFLNRAPDEAGLNAWVNVLSQCPDNGYGSAHPECDRVLVSSGFYRSQEFLGRGFFIYRAYDAALGRLPHYSEFMPELGRIGQAQTEAELDANKSAYLDDMMQRPEFADRYRGQTDAAHAEDFVSHLEQTAGMHVGTHAQLVADMRSGARSARDTLRAFLESPEVVNQFFNRGFVTMQYFGYLRRDPESAGWNAWVNIITNGAPGVAPGDFRPLIFGFVHSQEYRSRFGQP